MYCTACRLRSQHNEAPQGKSSSLASRAAKMLVDEALRNDTADNVTAIVIWIDWE